MKKYELTDQSISVNGRMLYKIKALIDFGNIKAGDCGGYIMSEYNLSQIGDAWVYDNAKVCDNADYIVFKNWWSSGRYFTWTRSNNMWKVGCFYGNCEDLIKKAYSDSDICGREYERIVQYVNSILQ